MASPPKSHAVCAAVAATALFCSPARALVTFNDGTDHVYVTGTASMAYDSNIFAHQGGEGDYVYSAGVLVEYVRRAGLIGVDGTMALNASRFGTNTGENFNNPKFGAVFTKATGRTTGALILGAARESEADLVANLRERSWFYSVDLKFKYPVITRYSLAGSFGFTNRVYDDKTVVSDLRTSTVGADLLYAIDSRHDLLAGCSFRNSDTSANTSYDDQSFTIGVTARILSKLNATLRAGYQIRSPAGAATGGGYRGSTFSGALTRTMSKKLSIGVQVSRDLSVTATDSSVQSSSIGVNGQYALNDKLSFSGNLGAGKSRYLGPPDAGREDDFFSWGSGVNYTMNEHLKSSLVYTSYENRSPLIYSDFSRQTITLMLSSRW